MTALQRLRLIVQQRDRKRYGDVWKHTVRANGHLFEILCHNSEYTPKKIQEINEQFKNSLRYLKHHGGYFDKTADEKDVKAAMNKWSSTITGLAIKIQDDPLTEFTPFQA